MIESAQPSQLTALVPLVEAYYAASPVPHTVDVSRLTAHMTQLCQPDNPLGGLLVAKQGDALIGFAFLYYGFDKRALARVVELNDLFVAESARRQGVAKELLQASFDWAKAHDAVSVQWQTRTSNFAAQQLYDQVGQRVIGWVHYAKTLD